jgi:DNA (cytosine-5)-methyltransferase 1
MLNVYYTKIELTTIWIIFKQKMDTNPHYTFIDLFAGMGSFHQSFKKFGWECVMASDIDKNACDVYEKNHGLKPLGDVCKIDPRDVKHYDIVCAGFSCQPFSQCGKQMGFDDPRGTMFYQVMKFAELKPLKEKPKFIILENVQALFNHNKGKTFKTMLAEIKKQGYIYTYKVLLCSDYGIPQLRKRLFVVCVRDDLVFAKDSLIQKLEDLLDFDEFKKDVTLSEYLPEVGRFVERDYAFTIRCGGRASPLRDRHNWDGYVITNGKKCRFGNEHKFDIWEEYRITPEIGLKLQGFPPDFKLLGSKTDKWNRLGNTIPTVFTMMIAKKINEIKFV